MLLLNSASVVNHESLVGLGDGLGVGACAAVVEVVVLAAVVEVVDFVESVEVDDIVEVFKVVSCNHRKI